MTSKEVINLETAIKWVEDLHKNLKDIFNEFISLKENDFVAQTHHGFGTTMRNELKLWEKSKITSWFNSKGIYHADDMSCIIMTSLWRKHNDVDIDLEGQIKHHIDFWEENDPNINKGIFNE